MNATIGAGRFAGAGLAVLLVTGAACHRPREMAPQIPLAGIDGNYAFTISNPFKLEGQLVVAHSRVYLIEPKRCVPIDGPKSSEEMRSSWYECVSGAQARPGEGYLRLRFSEVDLLNRSRWYARMRVPDTVLRCTRYQTTGDCVEVLRARGMKWVDRNGSITVVKGFVLQPDTGRGTILPGSKPLRTRCDTTVGPAPCSP
jgi:hypothetical protein